jgi:putative transposase
MKMFAIKRALKLNNREATLTAKHAGFRRVVFKMGLSLRTQMYGEAKLSDNKVINEVKKVLTNYVKKQPQFNWMNQHRIWGFTNLGVN